MSDNIVYSLGDSLYLNITNKCPCACTFCVRDAQTGVGDKDSLWLTSEPTFEDVVSQLSNYDVDAYKEFVFCGYGEPTESLDLLIQTASFIKERYNKPIRLNTNGLSDLINSSKTTQRLAAVIDTFSISLNAPNVRRYVELCHPVYGAEAYDAMLAFTTACKSHGIETILTVVDVISADEIDQCKKIADGLGVGFRVRHTW